MQQILPNIKAPEPHSNRGKRFEAMLERTHAFYLRCNIGKVEKIPNAFVFCTEGEYQKLLRGYGPNYVARTGDGRPLKRQKTAYDYRGHARGKPVCFDAKEFAEASIPVRNFKHHQARELFEDARSGAIAGFLVYSKRIDTVYWIEAEKILAIISIGSPKSLNIEWLNKNALVICERASFNTVDWAKVLVPDKR